MNKTATIISLLWLCAAGIPAPAQVKLHYDSNETPTYYHTMRYYALMADRHPSAALLEYGSTDAGRPLQLFVVSKDADFDPKSLRQRDKRIILINNAIHPGEPCGVDASLQFAGDLFTNRMYQEMLDNTIICIIPAYNIGGMLNRGSHSRANQNGPAEYGFRGNSRNLDLNRDFIKNDSKESKAFAEIYHTWRPDIFIDTHTSDGADYQHTMTLIATQRNKLHPLLGKYLDSDMVPELYRLMKTAGYPMAPYVNPLKETPDSGIVAYLETPRYSTGYTALFHTLGFVTEAHMIKPYAERVLATYHFLASVLKFTSENAVRIGKVRSIALQEGRAQKDFALSWKLDTTDFRTVRFMGYEAARKPSEVSGKDRLWYDRALPYERDIRYYNTYRPDVVVKVPYAYIIPQAWGEVIERLKLNRIVLQKLTADTLVPVAAYYIEDYETVRNPYEGHYLHYDVRVRKEQQHILFRKGDYVVPMDQFKSRFIAETLEPQATDSYFCWNFFDAVLMQKEWFSAWIFEDSAAALLSRNPALRQELDLRKIEDDRFAEDAAAQLNFVYRRSPWYEKSHRRYPVFRLEQVMALPVLGSE